MTAETAVSSIGVSDQGAEVVDIRGRRELGISHAGPHLTLFAVAKELGHEKVFDLVGHGVGRVIYAVAFKHGCAARQGL